LALKIKGYYLLAHSFQIFALDIIYYTFLYIHARREHVRLLVATIYKHFLLLSLYSISYEILSLKSHYAISKTSIREPSSHSSKGLEESQSIPTLGQGKGP
jgi:hypothetical protein